MISSPLPGWGEGGRGAEANDFHARRFDSQLGRWHAIDPVMQFASPYVGMGDNPVIGVDPDGTSWEFHGHQHFQQGYVNGEKVGDPIPGEIHGYWYWNDYPTFTSSGNFTIHPGNSGHAGSGGNGGGNSSNNGYHYIGGPDGDEEQNIQKPNIPELINDIYKLLNGIINSLVSHVELDNCETAARIADIVPDAIGFWVGGSFVAGHGASQQIGLVYVENYGWAIIGNTSGGFGWDVSLSGEMQLGWSDNPDISTYEGINWSTSGNVNAPPLGGLGLTASYFSDYNHFNQTFGQNWKGVSFGVSISPPIFNAPLSGQTSIGYTYVILRITKKP